MSSEKPTRQIKRGGRWADGDDDDDDDDDDDNKTHL